MWISCQNLGRLVPLSVGRHTRKNPEMMGPSSSTEATVGSKVVFVEDDEEADEPLLIWIGECRFCQEEDHLNNLESPCACSGSLKYAHRKCVQHWCNEKGDIICEICHQPYQPVILSLHDLHLRRRLLILGECGKYLAHHLKCTILIF